jgi:hypothetical protein
MKQTNALSMNATTALFVKLLQQMLIAMKTADKKISPI